MIRPPPKTYGKKKKRGKKTRFSNPDGTGLRRRYACYLGAFLLFLSAMIALMVSNRRPGKNAVAAGSVLKHYVVEKATYNEEMEADIKVLTHEDTGMQVLTVLPKDINQDGTFGITFRTKPNNNHGTAHVVEHALLNGSENYPVKDPFNQIKRGSLQTFLDTYTSKDRFVFLSASRNLKDFKNLMKVGLDAIFNPLMTKPENKWIFRQEGWRLELDGQKKPRLNGNAVNEAKAAQMHPNQVMINYIYETLFPDTSYRFNARGTTKMIPLLSHEEMIQFYENHFHPTNAQAFCYGGDDFILDCLHTLEPFLDSYERRDDIRKASTVDWQKLGVVKNARGSIDYASVSEPKDYRLVISWLLNDEVMDGRTQIAWHALEQLLLGGPTAAVSSAIFATGLADDTLGGLEFSLQQWTFTMGASGITSESDTIEIEETITSQLLDIAQNGFEDDDITAVLNNLDFRLRDVSSYGTPRGVEVFSTVMTKWNYDEDPNIALRHVHVLNELRESVRESGSQFFVDLITSSLIDNSHKVTFTMIPNENLTATLEEEEQEYVDNYSGELSKEEGLALLRETKHLTTIQEAGDTSEELAQLPSLELGDLPTKGYEIPVQVTKNAYESGVTVLKNTLDYTDGVVYVDFAIDMSRINFAHVNLIPFLCLMMRQAHTESLTQADIQREIYAYTGGVSVAPIVEDILPGSADNGYYVPDGTHMITKIVAQGSAIAETGGLTLLNVIRQLLFEVLFDDQQQAIRILRSIIDDMEDSLQEKGYIYTSLWVKSKYSIPGYIREHWSGVAQLMYARRILYLARHNFEKLQATLYEMLDDLLAGHRNGMVMSVTGDKAALEAFEPSLKLFLTNSLPDTTNNEPLVDFAVEPHPWVAKAQAQMMEEDPVGHPTRAFLAPSRVNYVAKGGIIYDKDERISGADAVVTQYLSGYYLFNEVRFTLGARRAWAELDLDAGAIVYQSERDPSITETLEIFENAASFAWSELGKVQGLPTEAVNAIAGTIGKLDGTTPQPLDVGMISLVRHLKRQSAAQRQVWRDEILGVTREDFIEMVENIGGWGFPTVAVVTSPRHHAQALRLGMNFTVCDHTAFYC